MAERNRRDALLSIPHLECRQPRAHADEEHGDSEVDHLPGALREPLDEQHEERDEDEWRYCEWLSAAGGAHGEQDACGSDHDAHEFRNRIIETRDALRHGARGVAAQATGAEGPTQVELMQAMVAKLDEIAALLRERR